MKEIIVWNDYCIEENYDKSFDEKMRSVFSRSFDGCRCTYIGKIETQSWIDSLPKEKGISIGKRPIKIWKEDKNIPLSRVFDNNRNICDYQMEEYYLKEYGTEIQNGSVVIHEDAIVEGNTLLYLLNKLHERKPDTHQSTITVRVFFAVESGIDRIKKAYDNIQIEAEYYLPANDSEVWNSTVLFLSDLLELEVDGKLFIEDERRFRQCFYSSYEEVLKECIRARQQK